MFVAMIAVGTLLIFSFNSYAATLRFIPETEQLDNLLNYVAAKATELITSTQTGTTQFYLDLPTGIGDQQYWIRLQNDTFQSCVVGGFGTDWNITSSYEVFLPGNSIATGYHLSLYGPAVLESWINGSVHQLFLTSARDLS
jgi:hypothetical protein